MSTKPVPSANPLVELLRLLESTPPAPWSVDTGTMADKMTGCWLIRSSDRHDFPSWLLATSGHKDARQIAELVCLMRNTVESLVGRLEELDRLLRDVRRNDRQAIAALVAQAPWYQVPDELLSLHRRIDSVLSQNAQASATEAGQ